MIGICEYCKLRTRINKKTKFCAPCVRNWQRVVDNHFDGNPMMPLEIAMAAPPTLERIISKPPQPLGGPRGKAQSWANNCAVYETHHRLEDNFPEAEYYRGAKEAFERVVGVLGTTATEREGALEELHRKIAFKFAIREPHSGAWSEQAKVATEAWLELMAALERAAGEKA